MVIQKSSVGMNSDRSFVYSQHIESESVLTTADKAATLEFTEGAESMVTQMRKMKQKNWREGQDGLNQQEPGGLLLLKAGKTSRNAAPWVSNEQEMKLELLRRIMEGLMRTRNGNFYCKSPANTRLNNGCTADKGFAMLKRQITGEGGDGSADGPASVLSGGRGFQATVMTRTTAVSSFISEQETTKFSAEGMVKTADGRNISFNMDVEMSREFYAHNQQLVKEDCIFIDPLVINYDGDIAELGDQKFFFDLDSDGSSEEISFVGEGSGFLALDKNGDGKINDGSELFGTKSGNGFADLSAYDKDGNGWIDEADEIFNRLRIWTKDKDGKDRLLSLKDAGVGALYLQNADTEFTMKNRENGQVNGAVRRTGVFLKEDGGAGTLQHIDLAL